MRPESMNVPLQGNSPGAIARALHGMRALESGLALPVFCVLVSPSYLSRDWRPLPEHRRAGEEWVSHQRYALPEVADRGRGEESHKRQVRPQPARVGSHVRRQYGRSQVHDRALEVCKPAIDHTIWPGCACRSAWIRSAPM